MTAQAGGWLPSRSSETEPRPYKGPLSNEQALKVMEEEVSRGWWDPVLFAEFRKMMMAK